MNKEFVQTHLTHSENRHRSSLKFRALGSLVILLVSFFSPACTKNIDPFYYGSDAHSAEVDRSVASAFASIQNNTVSTAEAQIKATHTSQQKPVETLETQVSNLTNNDMFCATVVPGGNLREAAEAANEKAFVPRETDIIPLQVGYLKDRKPVIIGIEELRNMTLANSPIVYPGDQVCLSTNADLLKKQLTLTP